VNNKNTNANAVNVTVASSLGSRVTETTFTRYNWLSNRLNN